MSNSSPTCVVAKRMSSERFGASQRACGMERYGWLVKGRGVIQKPSALRVSMISAAVRSWVAHRNEIGECNLGRGTFSSVNNGDVAKISSRESARVAA